MYTERFEDKFSSKFGDTYIHACDLYISFRLQIVTCIVFAVI